MDMNYKTTMWAEMKPDLYAGTPCGSETKPLFECSCDGDMGSETLSKISLAAKDFPPGTMIRVEVPCCPGCGQEVELCRDDEGCSFDWDDWVAVKYS